MSSRASGQRVRGETLFTIAAIALFFLTRLTLLVVRDPFFDELFTVWMARKPFGAILPALLVDSGPPLYYFVARIADVMALRVLSLLFATAMFASVLTRKSLGDARYLAALLLALYPPAALFAVDARSYALCALFVGIGAIAIHEERPGVAAGSFVLAAYTHWYGALFLPLVLLARPRRRSAIAMTIAAVAFLPGLYFASRQPMQATEWLAQRNALAPFGAFAFAGRSAEALFVPMPGIVVLVSTIAVLVAGARSAAFLPLVVAPILLAIAFAVAGRTAYFPLRFESVLAVPLVLWLGTSLVRWAPAPRIAMLLLLCGCGAAAIAHGALDHARRPLDSYRQAALILKRSLRSERVVASGFLYLEAAHAVGAQRVIAYPAEQGRHPGWRVMHPTNEPLPQGEFVWIGERAAPELSSLRGRRANVLFANDRALILRVR